MTDEEAYAEICRRDFGRLCRFLCFRGASWEDALDAAQEAYLQLHKKFAEVVKPEAWLRTTALRELRNCQGRERKEADGINAMGQFAHRFHIDHLSDATQLVLKAVRRLPQQQREIMALVIDGFTPKEIGEILNISPNAVSGSLYQARLRLRRLLAPDFPDLNQGERQ
jgi:RNA polymerase sigma-70 factor (ECF subfamily)